MGLEKREARPDRQDRRHQQAGPEIQGRRRPAAAPETSRAGPGILRRSAPALYRRITGIGRPTYALLSKAATSAKSLGVVITSEAVIDQIRRELRRQTG